MRLTPASEIKSRIEKLQNKLEEQEINAALIVQSADLFYFSGIFQNAYLYIPSSGKPVMFVRRDYERARQSAPLEHVERLESLKKLPSFLLECGFVSKGTLGLELDVLPTATYLYYLKLFKNSGLDCNVKDCSGIIREMRSIKSPYEIEITREVADMMISAFQEVPNLLEVGKSEVELAGRLEAILRQKGHQGLVRVRGFNQEFFYGHFLTGVSGGVPSYFDGPVGGPGLNLAFPFGTSEKVLQRNEPVLVDYVGAKEGYVVDMTRVFVVGELPAKLVKAYELAVQIQEAVVKKAGPGAVCGELYELAVEKAKEFGLAENFMGYPHPVSFVGHGVGLELNELPVLAYGVQEQLKEGMIFALEPKFVFPDEGAVGIENTFLVTTGGVKKLTMWDEGIIRI